MLVVSVQLDSKAESNMRSLKQYFGAQKDTDIIRKGIALLTKAMEIEESQGKLIAKKDGQETEIILRRSKERKL